MTLLAGAALLINAPALKAAEGQVGQRLERQGDEIVVCGQFFHTKTPVVLWLDPGGYDAYRVDRRFVPANQAGWEASKAAGLSSPQRYNMRQHNLSAAQIEAIRRDGWTLEKLQDVVDQFVLHYDVAGTSRRCFQVLQDARGLSVHFMLDVDGTIYQTLDLKERAWHATKANSRSIGIEIANMGAYSPSKTSALDRWYTKGPDGLPRLVIPKSEEAWLKNPRASLRPARDKLIVGQVQGQELAQYDLTPEQYDALIKLTATLAEVFPKIKLQYPHDAQGRLITRTLSDDAYEKFQGVLGHYHVQTNKVDPGPAFQWDHVLDEARKLVEGATPKGK